MQLPRRVSPRQAIAAGAPRALPSRNPANSAADRAWFKNCGDGGDTTFDHTWAEGIQACKGFVSSRLADPSLRVIPSHPQNASQRQTNRYRAVSMANAGVQDCAECFGSPKIIVFICVLFILLHLQMLFHFS